MSDRKGATQKKELTPAAPRSPNLKESNPISFGLVCAIDVLRERKYVDM
jgi:hypothetical protein